MVPLALLDVDAGLEVSRSSAAVSARPAGGHQLEPGRLQRVEGLLEEGVLQVEAGRVALVGAAVRVATLVQRVAERVPAQRDPTADEYTRDFAEPNVRPHQPVGNTLKVRATLEKTAVSLNVE